MKARRGSTIKNVQAYYADGTRVPLKEAAGKTARG